MADQEVPEEVQEYYQTERRERTGVAWLLAFGTLIVTVLLAGGIFFGGRALYRNFTGTEEPDNPEVAQNEQEEQDPATESANDQPETPPNENEPAGGQGQENDVQGDSTETDTPPAEESTPATGDASGSIPNTGPGSTVAIFFAVSTLGYLLHRAYLKSS